MPTAPTPRLDALAAVTRWHTIEHREVVTSTNTLVAERAAAGARPGLVLAADRQSAGRGRLDRRWEDRPGGASLAVTCLVTPPGSSPATLLVVAAGLAAVAAAGIDAVLKWPNDVLSRAGERKLAGILVEPAPPAGFAVGIGLNVDWRGVDRDGHWSSIAEEAGRDVDRFDVFAEFLRAFDTRLDEVEEAPAAVLDDYRRACVTLGREVRVITSGGVLVGTAEDVDPSGALLLRTGERELVVSAGDVEHVRPLA